MTDTTYRDPSFRYPILVSGIPLEVDVWSYLSGTITSSTQTTVAWTTTPANSQLSLWNFAWTVRVGVDDADHNWPNGSALDVDQSANMQMYAHTDALESSDTRNTRVNKIVIRNVSGSDQAIFMYFKSYTFATSVGITA